MLDDTVEGMVDDMLDNKVDNTLDDMLDNMLDDMVGEMGEGNQNRALPQNKKDILKYRINTKKVSIHFSILSKTLSI